MIEAAARSVTTTEVVVVDNNSTDDSIQFLQQRWPQIAVNKQPNLGLASFNNVLKNRTEDVVLLLNNDLKLTPDAVDPLVKAVLQTPDALFAAPACWGFDKTTYEGMRTRVRSRFGMVQGRCRVPGFEKSVFEPGDTASAGPVLAVHRQRFLQLGGYDPLYFPGRIEDLDLGFQGWMAGYRGLYVPESITYHQGFGSFEPTLGRKESDRLALRNTLLFAWKNLSGSRLAGHLGWLPVRLLYATLTRRNEFLQAFKDAIRMIRSVHAARKRAVVVLATVNEVTIKERQKRQEAYFHHYRW